MGQLKERTEREAAIAAGKMTAPTGTVPLPYKTLCLARCCLYCMQGGLVSEHCAGLALIGDRRCVRCSKPCKLDGSGIEGRNEAMFSQVCGEIFRSRR